MDTVLSFKGYGKVDPAEQAAFRAKTRKRVCYVSISLLVLLGLVIGIVAGTIAHNKKDSGESPASSSATSAAIKTICGVTQFPESCATSLSSSNSSNPSKLFHLSLSVLMTSLEKISTFPAEYANKTDDPLVKEALNVCGTVLNDAVETLNDTISAMHDKSLLSKLDDLKTWLSTVIADQETCSDALKEINSTFSGEVEVLMRNSTEFASNSLAIVSKIVGVLGDFKIPKIHGRRLMGATPAWVDRRLLQTTAEMINVTVAKDGSGDVRTVGEAVARVPKKSMTRFVIYVKAGVYEENVLLDKSCWNLTIFGDGKKATIISGSKNYVDGTSTFNTATFGVAGKGFIARDIGFKNTAGPEKHQAVAFRSSSDMTVMYRCSFDAFQDTLYAHSNRQFYRDCDITGTVDFIFGYSAVVFQNCNILPRQPMPGQYVTITAQGKKDPHQVSGISIQRCTISPLDNLTAETYLGRPWKNHSTTVIMETSIGGFLNPKGWISWVSGVDPPKSIFYAEYQNTGPGANTTSRVTWSGYKPTITEAEASKFNVESFIDGREWLPATSVKFDSN